jgi:fibronectin-binding autotransporter adhesin
VVLSGDNTYSGGTTVASGATLQAGSATALSSTSVFTVDGTLDLHGFNTTMVSLSGTGTVTNAAFRVNRALNASRWRGLWR